MKPARCRPLHLMLALTGLATSGTVLADTRTHSEPVGPFEVVTTRDTRRLTLFNPTGPMIDRRPTVNERHSLRHRGHPLSLTIDDPRSNPTTQRHAEVWRAWILPSTEPAILALVGDINHGSSWLLVRDESAQARIDVIAHDRGNGYTGMWLDGESRLDRDSQGVVPVLAVQAGHIDGGRWLLLGSTTVFDTQTLQWHALAPSRDIDVSRQMALGIAPDASAVARHAHVRSTGREVIVVDRIGGGDPTLIPIDRQRLRYRDRADLTPAWLMHHFEWRGSRLELRRDVAPMAYRGEWLWADGDGDNAEYRLRHVERGIGEVMAGILLERFAARFEPDPRPYQPRLAQAAPYGRYHIGAHVLVLMHSAADEYEPAFMGLYGDSNTRRGIGPLLRQLGEAMDAELASGRHDALFDPP